MGHRQLGSFFRVFLRSRDGSQFRPRKFWRPPCNGDPHERCAEQANSDEDEHRCLGLKQREQADADLLEG